MKPRIYTYKITFPCQGWWYWGVHKERKFGEEYNGSPVTHKKKWDSFEWEMQILEFFDTWEEACSVENRLIKPDLNNPNCLNENNGGSTSLESRRRGGKIAVESGHLASIRTPESCSKGGKISGRKNVESGQLASIASKGGRIAGRIAVESGQLASIASKGGKAAVESGHLASISSKGGKIQGRKNVESGHFEKIKNYRYKCLVTGHISTAGPLTCYQKAKGIDTSLRERVN